MCYQGKSKQFSYHNYLIIGGMPECVASWIKYKDPAKISQIQRELIEIYDLLMVFRSIVSQLAKPNEKFMYGAVREGGRARDFEEAIELAGFSREIDFVIQYGTDIIPVEAKGGEDKSAAVPRRENQKAALATRR